MEIEDICTIENLIEMIHEIKLKNHWSDRQISEIIGCNRNTILYIYRKQTISLRVLYKVILFLRQHGFVIKSVIRKGIVYNNL